MDRPHVHINVAASADGKIDTFERRGAAISSPRDRERVDRLRAEVDGVMAGGRTLLDEDPRLTGKSETLRADRAARGLPQNPAKVGVVSQAAFKPDCAFLTAGPARILLFTTARTEPAQIEMLRGLGVEVFVGPGPRVDLESALRTLRAAGIQRLLVEGGATLNFELLRLGLVDELSIYVAPLLFGGGTAPTLAAGPGLPRGQAIPIKLEGAEAWEDGGVLLRYSISR